MSVLIKGMKMPTSCIECKFSDWSSSHQTACCKLNGYEPCFEDHRSEYKTERGKNCPLVETVRVTSARMVANEDALRIPAEAIKHELVYGFAEEVASVTRVKVQDVPELNSKEFRMSLVIVPEERGAQSVSIDQGCGDTERLF